MLIRLFLTSILITCLSNLAFGKFYYINEPKIDFSTIRNGDQIYIKKDLFTDILKFSVDESVIIFSKVQDELCSTSENPAYYVIYFYDQENKLSNYASLNSEIDYKELLLKHNSKLVVTLDEINVGTVTYLNKKEITLLTKDLTQELTIKTDIPVTKEVIIPFKRGQNILADAYFLENENNENEDKIKLLKSYGISNLASPFLKHLGLDIKNNTEKRVNLSNIAKADVTNFATGMARFLAERAKQELNESFFDQMRKQMDKLPELQFFFPQTYLFLYELNAHLKSFNLEVLRDRFNQDIANLPSNIYQTTMNIDSYNGKQLNALRTFHNYLEHDKNGQFVNLGLQAVLNNNTGLNPKDLFYNFVHNDSLLLKLENNLLKEKERNQSSVNLLNAIKLIELISNSLLSPETDRYWVRIDEINELLTNKELFTTYIGLLLAKSDFNEYEIKFGGKPLQTLITDQFTINNEVGNLEKLENLIQSVFMLFNEVDEAIQKIKTTESGNSIDNSYNLYSVFSKSVTAIVTKLDQQKILGTSFKFNTDIVTNYLTSTVDLAYNIYSKKYSLAISDFVQLLSNVTKVEEPERIAQLLKASPEEKKRLITQYYFENYSAYRDTIIEKLKISGNLLATLITDVNYNREKLILLAKKYQVIKEDPKLLKAYLLTTDSMRNRIIKHFADNSKDGKQFILDFLDDKKNRATIFPEEWITLLFDEKIPVETLLANLLEQKQFRAYLDNHKAYQQFVQNFSRYGTLIGNVANAQSSDEVKAAIEASVLPVGSSRIKRYAKFSIGLNAFVGAYYGNAYYKDSNGLNNINSFGITAPIGISMVWGTRNFIGKSNAIGLNIQLIDLGSLVNFYYTKGDGAQLPAGTKIQLGDILAPGATVSYSLFNSPFSIMGGVQYVPNLSRMPEISTNNEFRALTWRWHVGLTIDIPLFMIKTNPR